MIEIKDLSKSFGDFKALDGLSMTVPKGSVYGLVGPNGAGKSTLIRHLTGILQPDSGEITLEGQKVYENPAAKQRIGYIPDDIFYFPSATMEDMHKFYRGIYEHFDEELYEKLYEVFKLPRKSPIRKFSKGMQKQAAFHLTICTRPDVMVLDEPVDGLDPVMRRQVWSLLMGDVAQRQTTVLISSHNLRELEDICDHVGIMDHGKMLLQKSLADMQGSTHKIQLVGEPPEGMDVLHTSASGRLKTLVVRGMRRRSRIFFPRRTLLTTMCFLFLWRRSLSMNWEVWTMKLRTSSSDTLLKKNLTRFLPFWGLYTLCLLLGLLVIVSGERDSFYQAMNLAASARAVAPIVCIYALLVAELLFGDLFDSRMCNGLHSLPLRRETIFGVNILSGVLFSLVPTLLMTLVSLPIMARTNMVNGWQISLYWLLAVNLQFLFFYGLAVFCVFLTGNRFAMAVVYGIVNIWSLLLQLVVDVIYLPMLFGVSVNTKWFQLLSPIYHIMDTRLLYVEREELQIMGTFRLEPGWGYLWICAGVGLLLMGLALVLYRKRKLETAGDFIAVKPIKPVFLVIFSLMAACGFVLCGGGFFGLSEDLTLLILFSVAGLVIGWFVGAMLMEKSMRIFTKKNLLGGGILTAAVLLSMLVTWLDPLGIHKWIPDEQEVAYVRLTNNYNYYGSAFRTRGETRQVPEGQLPLDAITELGDIHCAVRLHELALEQKLSQATVDQFYEPYRRAAGTEEAPPDPAREPFPISLEYTMKNGKVIRRYYYLWSDGEAGQLASWLFSQPQLIFGDLEVLDQMEETEYLNIYDVQVPEEYLDAENMAELRQAILQDCEEGHMAQVWELHHGEIFSHPKYPMEVMFLSADSYQGGFYLNIFGDAAHTLGWMEDRGILDTVRENWEEEIASYDRP